MGYYVAGRVQVFLGGILLLAARDLLWLVVDLLLLEDLLMPIAEGSTVARGGVYCCWLLRSSIVAGGMHHCWLLGRAIVAGEDEPLLATGESYCCCWIYCCLGGGVLLLRGIYC